MFGEGQVALADLAAALTGGGLGCAIVLCLVVVATFIDRRNHREPIGPVSKSEHNGAGR